MRREPNMTDRELKQWIYDQCKVDGNCKIWTGGCNQNQTPIISVRGKKMTIRRYLYETIMKVELTRDEFVLVHCGNHKCLEITHMYIGSQMDIIEQRTESTYTNTFRNPKLCVIQSCKELKYRFNFCEKHYHELVPKSTRVFEYDETGHVDSPH